MCFSMNNKSSLWRILGLKIVGLMETRKLIIILWNLVLQHKGKVKIVHQPNILWLAYFKLIRNKQPKIKYQRWKMKMMQLIDRIKSKQNLLNMQIIKRHSAVPKNDHQFRDHHQHRKTEYMQPVYAIYKIKQSQKSIHMKILYMKNKRSYVHTIKVMKTN